LHGIENQGQFVLVPTDLLCLLFCSLSVSFRYYSFCFQSLCGQRAYTPLLSPPPLSPPWPPSNTPATLSSASSPSRPPLSLRMSPSRPQIHPLHGPPPFLFPPFLGRLRSQRMIFIKSPLPLVPTALLVFQHPPTRPRGEALSLALPAQAVVHPHSTHPLP
jgi:hypothetical protein